MSSVLSNKWRQKFPLARNTKFNPTCVNQVLLLTPRCEIIIIIMIIITCNVWGDPTVVYWYNLSVVMI